MFNGEKFQEKILELIKDCSMNLSEDIYRKLKKYEAIADNATSKNVLTQIINNVDMASKDDIPICQDTGMLFFYVKIPYSFSDVKILKSAISAAVIEATEKSYLRPNAVDSLTGQNSGDNTGIMCPYIYIDYWEEENIEIKLMMKGGGSENMSAQYSLPNKDLGAGRNLDGVYKCVIDSVQKAQGFGCAPGILGVAIGGDRASGYFTAKCQLFRDLEDTNKNAELAKLEIKLEEDLNKLNIGPMGFGGNPTVLGVKIDTIHRIPASFFVSIAYSCWATRRKTILI